MILPPIFGAMQSVRSGLEKRYIASYLDFIFLGSKITADGDCSHEIKTLAPWKKSYDQPR